MPDIEKTAETSIEQEPSNEVNANYNTVDGVADINKEEENVNDVEFTDTKADESDDSSKPEVKKTQSNAQNSEYARKRREAERKAELERAKEEARNNAIIEFTNGVNPYTDEEIKDKVDIEKYLAMKEIEKNGGDPIADYHKVQSKKQKEEIETRKKADDEKQWYADDRKDFFSKHPEMTDATLSTLLQNEQFLLYGDGKFGNKPLAEIYDGFNKMMSTFENKAKSMAEKMYANKQSSPGSLNSTEVSKTKSWADMSPKEFEAEIQKAKNGGYKQT
jgi:hypothetical protein